MDESAAKLEKFFFYSSCCPGCYCPPGCCPGCCREEVFVADVCAFDNPTNNQANNNPDNPDNPDNNNSANIKTLLTTTAKNG